ncbi:MAG: hypothetical protein EOP00_16415 [Pedobacter sp.]|nr:MAG: hypothetical protein EOP00_16415 [Pedobacter sp.]
MKRILYILALASLTACNNKKPEPVQGYSATPNGLADLQKPASPTATAASSTTAPASGSQSNLLLNPAHGEPGHDCSVAVGAPLKASARANTATAQAQQTVQTVSPQPTATSTPQAAVATVDSKGQKLNPAHGQPNHRCDIAVGAPLNSKSTQTVTTSAKPQLVTQPATPATTSQVPVLNEKGQRLNPAHGQPGHSCAIAVGEPLT